MENTCGHSWWPLAVEQAGQTIDACRCCHAVCPYSDLCVFVRNTAEQLNPVGDS